MVLRALVEVDRKAAAASGGSVGQDDPEGYTLDGGNNGSKAPA